MGHVEWKRLERSNDDEAKFPHSTGESWHLTHSTRDLIDERNGEGTTPGCTGFVDPFPMTIFDRQCVPDNRVSRLK